MSKKPEEEIEEKLRELEATMKESAGSNVPSEIKQSTGVASTLAHISFGELNRQDEANTMKADVHLLGGFSLLLVGIFILFSHLTVHAGQLPFWGAFGVGNGTGALILLLLVGMGFFFYDYKNKIGWMLIICSLAALVFSLFFSMQLFLAPMSLLSLLVLFLPWVIGGALVAKGIRMASQIHNTQNSHYSQK